MQIFSAIQKNVYLNSALLYCVFSAVKHVKYDRCIQYKRSESEYLVSCYALQCFNVQLNGVFSCTLDAAMRLYGNHENIFFVFLAQAVLCDHF